jgi:hypothetical protein
LSSFFFWVAFAAGVLLLLVFINYILVLPV